MSNSSRYVERKLLCQTYMLCQISIIIVSNESTNFLCLSSFPCILHITKQNKVITILRETFFQFELYRFECIASFTASIEAFTLASQLEFAIFPKTEMSRRQEHR